MRTNSTSLARSPTGASETILSYLLRFTVQWYHLFAIIHNIIAWNISRRQNAVYFNRIIEHQELALQHTNPGEWWYSSRVRILSKHYMQRYHTQRNPKDLDYAIIFSKMFTEATILSSSSSFWTTKDHIGELSSGYHEVSVLYMTRFRLLRTLGDLDEASINLRRAIELLESSKKTVPFRIWMELADSLGNRSFFRSDPTDASEALIASKKAAEIANHGANLVHKAFSLARYAECLGYNMKHEELDGVNDIVGVHQQALEILPKDHREKPFFMTRLASAMTRQAILEFWKEEMHENDYPPTMDRALEYFREALATLDKLSPTLSNSFVDEGHLFILVGLARHYDSRQRVCLYSSIDDARKALSYLDQIGHIPKGSISADIWIEVESIRISALQQISRYSGSSKEQDIVVKLYRDIVTDLDVSLNVRLAAARFWAAFARSSRHSTVPEAADWVVKLQQYRAGLGIDSEEQVRYLGSGYRSEAVNAVIPFGSDSSTITEDEINNQVSFIESTLSLFWLTRMKTAGSFDVIAEHSPTLKTELEEKAAFLNSRTETDFLQDSAVIRNADAEVCISAIRNAREEFEALLYQVRQIEGLQYFMKSRPFLELSQAANEGHIIILDAMGGSTCNVFALSPGWTSARRLELGSSKYSFGYSAAKDLCEEWAHLTRIAPKVTRSNRTTKRVRLDGIGEEQAYKIFLGKLWLKIVNPILEQLALKEYPGGPLPRIWWLPTGILTSLPLHAAGTYDIEEECITKYVVSSYLHSITSLIDARKGLRSSALVPQRFLAVGVSSAPGTSPLPNAIPEVESIASLVEGSTRVTILKNENASKNAIKTQLPGAQWCHFACHAVQDTHSALSSHLVLQDDRLTLEDVMSFKHKSAEFVMLSACETCTGDATLTEDALHLAAGFMFAGFKGVIATQYSMYDADGPFISRSIYQNLLQGETWHVEESARALHHSVESLRKHAPFRRWIPFVHFGV